MGGSGESTDSSAGVAVVLVVDINGAQRPVSTISTSQLPQQKKKCPCQCLNQQWTWQAYAACVCSFLVTMIGGAILIIWDMKYHPSNSQLWMVPFGLIFFATPIFVGFASVVSELLSSSSSSTDSSSSSLPLSVLSS